MKMGKRARKTRWRALDIADEHSDSEESNTNSSAVSSRNSHSNSNGYYSKYSYSSQSTPARRRYHQYDGSTKSTRSSSTTSETKITFNEDEYTRITTPRQDVLFKKGYLNKPKSYQTQTSTGNSTISTGNSTENGTPDHQSTDLDYESQFMFPNGFVDQNGIYYVNSYEPYPLMLFNPPTYYHECSNIKSKRMSTGSLSESMSPNNEEATSQDLSPSGGDASNSVSDYSGGAPVYNMVFPGYYVNGACPPADLANGHLCQQEPVKKLKKRRERRSSKNIQEDSSEFTDENSCDENSEIISPSENPVEPTSRVEAPASEDLSICVLPNEASNDPKEEELKTACKNSKTSDKTLLNGCADTKTESNDEKPDFDQAQLHSDCPISSVLKPDAEEFVPRAYLPLGPPPHIKMLPPNFMPIPLVPFNDFGGQNFAPHPAFIPPGIPINFIPHHPGQKVFPPAPGFVSFAPPMIHEAKIEENVDQTEETTCNEEKESTATPAHTPNVEESKPVVHSKTIDIATVVSKLEAVKQQEKEESIAKPDDATAVVNETKPFVGFTRFKNPTTLKRNYYNKHKSSPGRSGDASPQIQNGYNSPRLQDSPNSFKNPPVSNGEISPQIQINGEPPNYRSSHVNHVELRQPVQNGHTAPFNYRNSPVRHTDIPHQLQNGHDVQKPVNNGINHSEKVPVTNGANLPTTEDLKNIRNSPERFRKSWKPNGHQHGHQNGYGSPRRVNNHQYNQSYQKPVVRDIENPNVNGELSPLPNKHYSETLKKAQIILTPKPKKHINSEQPVKTVETVANVPLKLEPSKPKSNQWISVSSRKKKKNKNMEEIDNDDDQDMLNESFQSDISSDFEAYDVRKLVDVDPSSLAEHNTQSEKKIEEILTIIAQNETLEVLTNGQKTQTDINIPEVSDIEKDIIVKIEEQDVILPKETPTESVTLNVQIEEKKEEPVSIKQIKQPANEHPEEESFKAKKKSKKGTQKPLTKKVIITDIDLSMTITEVKTPIKKIVTKIEENTSVEAKPEAPVLAVSKETVVDKETVPEKLIEQPEKKSKKKKKNKTSKTLFNGNVSGLNATPSIADDSYDFLLENNMPTETLEKTNDDISLELEKLIQKGMYSSLQEKIKSINVEPEADGFFKNFQAVPSPTKESTTTANGFMKTPDFNRIFQSTRQFLKPNMVSVEHDNTVAVDDIDNIKDNKTSSSGPDAADPSAGPFLDTANQVPEVQTVQEATTEVTDEPEAPAEIKEDREDNKKLYPITQAVKEWMSKTREATPEVEILKSPFTIQKEFGDNGSLNDDLTDPSDSDEDDEIILFSTDETNAQEEPNLLEYWENDVIGVETVSKDCDQVKDINSECSRVCTNGKACDNYRVSSIQKEEEEIEVYESKYGKNEALLELQRELEEKEAKERLPESFRYRTVCCSLQ